MENSKIYNKIFKKHCAVCGHEYMADIYDQGECFNCGWYNTYKTDSILDKVIFPNLVSLNKARKLYQEGKPFRPSLDDFIDGLFCYSEMEFWYKGQEFSLFRYEKEGIEMGWGPEDDEVAYFKDREDFIENAKIGDEFLRDVWDKVENPKYM